MIGNSPANTNAASAAQNAGYYDALWKKLAAELGDFEKDRAEFVVAGIKRHVRAEGLEILDFGCGRGWMAPFLAPFGRVTGIDFSKEGISIARRQYGEVGTFLLADPGAPQLGIPVGKQFDVVVSSEVIEHVLDHESFMAQIVSLMKPQGWCFLTTPNGNVWDRFRSDARFKPGLQPIENWLTPAKLSALLRRYGLGIVRHEGRPMYDFRWGIYRVLLKRRVHAAFRFLNLNSLYGKVILPVALFQAVIARKLNERPGA